MEVHPIAKILIVTGIALILIGVVWALISHFGGRGFPLGRLPGDIVIERENFKFYFPLASSILVSLLLSAFLYLIRRR